MRQSRLTVTMQIDGCRSDYISSKNTPFLFSLKQKGISGFLSPTFGFEPDAAYLAGLWPDECDGGMHFWYSPVTSLFQKTQCIVGHFDILPNLIKKVVRWVLYTYAQRNADYSRQRYVTSIGRIPFKLIHCFDLAEKYLLYEDQFADRRSIFTALRKSKKSFLFHGAPTFSTRPEDVYKRLVGTTFPFEFIFLHTGIVDNVGHKFGPFSGEVTYALRRVDRVVNKIWQFLKTRYGEFNLVVFGDHGMVEVKEMVDLQAKINELGLKLGEDYVYFLDSTLARFWWFNEIAKETIKSALSGIQHGHILTEEDKSRYHLNYRHNKFGDCLFLVDPGTLIFPNFWNDSKPEKGMHGYAPECNGQKSALIIYTSFKSKRNILERPIDMRRIFPTLLKLTGLNGYKGIRVDSIV